MHNNEMQQTRSATVRAAAALAADLGVIRASLRASMTKEGPAAHSPRRGSRAEVAAWWVLAWMVGSTVIALFPYPYIGFLSFLLLPVAAISWSRTIILSTPARDGGRRTLVVAGLALATLIGAAILFGISVALFGHPTGRD